MTRVRISRAILIALVVAVGVGGWLLSSAQVAAQAQGLRVPTFEVDKTWPKVPEKFRIGDPSSIAVNAQDQVFVLHRPRTLKPDQAKMAAPPVIVFDAAGNYVKSWGGDAQRLRMAAA